MLHKIDRTVNDFTEVVRRNIGRHTYRNAHGAVNEKVRETGRKNHGFLLAVIEVRSEINDVFLNIRHHFVSELGKSRLRITVSSRAVTVHVTEVTVTVNQRISHVKGLCKTNHRVVYGSVSVRMVTSEYVTDRRC